MYLWPCAWILDHFCVHQPNTHYLKLPAPLPARAHALLSLALSFTHPPTHPDARTQMEGGGVREQDAHTQGGRKGARERDAYVSMYLCPCAWILDNYV